jgi:Skp family chaperone for outer membrane proteins
LRKSAIGNIEAERIAINADLAATEKELEEEEDKLQELIRSGKVNARFYTKPKDSSIYILRDPNERIKFRKTYHEQPGGRIADEIEAHEHREAHAKAYYQTITNQTPEDTINQIMGKFTGNAVENHTKQRTINIPDKVLYENKFMTKNLLSKVANYKMWLARRTHLQNTFGGLSIDGGFEPVIRDIHEQFDRIHTGLNNEKEIVKDKLKNENLSLSEKNKLEKGIKQIDKAINKNRKEFNKGVAQVKFAYEKMMGISKLSQRAKTITSSLRSFNVAANLPFLTLTMITDLTGNGLKNGLIPFVVDGVYPAIQSLGGLLKTHDSESLRKTAGALNLAIHHYQTASATRQMDLSTNPYLNLGKIPAALDKLAHFTSNLSLSTSIDNALQYITSAISQSNVIRHMQEFADGKLSKGDRLWLNKYGLDPEKDSAAILAAFKKDGGGHNSLGGYQSNFWHWEDIETANKVGDAVFRATHDTIISANSLDTPIWLDENGVLNFMAPIIRGFKGWAFASLNRYLIPSLQRPDAQKLMAFAVMSASAALVGPSRRIAMGQDPYTNKNGEKLTNEQIIAEILLDSPQLAWVSEGLNDMNLLAGGTLLGDLKNNKYYDRARIGVMGPTFSNGNKLLNFIDAMATGNMNEQDTMGMASITPVVNSLWGYSVSKHIIDSFGEPKYRSK